MLRRSIRDDGIRPGLAVVMIGENPASAVDVRNKVRACADVGISSQVFEFPATVSEAETLDLFMHQALPAAAFGQQIEVRDQINRRSLGPSSSTSIRLALTVEQRWHD